MSTVPNDLLLSVYACAQEPTRWGHVLDLICERLRVRSAVLQLLPRERTGSFQQWIARDTHSLANAALHDALINNPSNPRLDQRVAEPVVHGRFTRDRERFRAGCPHFAQLRQRSAAAGLGEAMGMRLPIAHDRDLVFLLHAHANVTHEIGQGDEQFVLELSQHLRQAVELSDAAATSRRENELLGGLIDTLGTGVVVVGDGQRIEWMNPAGREAMERSPQIATSAGRLRVLPGRHEPELRQMFGPPPDGIPRTTALTIEGGDDEPLRIVAVPLRGEAGYDGHDTRGRVALLFKDPMRRQAVAPEVLSSLFALSRAEAGLAAALCRGETVSDHARQRGISVGTVRVQLKQVFTKTGTCRQADLVRLVLSSIGGAALGCGG